MVSQPPWWASLGMLWPGMTRILRYFSPVSLERVFGLPPLPSFVVTNAA